MSFLYVLLGLFGLFLTQRRMTLSLSRLIHRLGGNQNLLIWFWSLVFLPGTIIHEISHFLVAAATGARTGNIEIFPEFIDDFLEKKERHGVALGSVQVARMNPLQGFLVGLAPFLSGMVLLIWLASLMRVNYSTQNISVLSLQIYLFFVIANSFFPSWTDIKQTLPLFALSAVAILLAWFFGFQLVIGTASPVWPILDSMAGALLLSLLFNLVIIGFLFLVNSLRRR